MLPSAGTTVNAPAAASLPEVPLLLWDIDGTLLLRASREHAEAIHAAIRRVYRVEVPIERVEAAGRTDFAIARSILTLAGVSAERVDERLGDLRAAAVQEYARRVPSDLSDHLAPHVPVVLDELAKRADVRLSLVTGNLEPIARMKLRAAGIGHHFPDGQGGFGSDAEDRTELPGIARARAGNHAPEDTIVIGDTPRDIACARADGVRVIAVTTGPFDAHALRGADAVCRDAREVLAKLQV
jgi:phosphoglycolate phosphatase-like HAD superfamily hydrolase